MSSQMNTDLRNLWTTLKIHSGSASFDTIKWCLVGTNCSKRSPWWHLQRFHKVGLVIQYTYLTNLEMREVHLRMTRADLFSSSCALDNVNPSSIWPSTITTAWGQKQNLIRLPSSDATLCEFYGKKRIVQQEDWSIKAYHAWVWVLAFPVTNGRFTYKPDLLLFVDWW